MGCTLSKAALTKALARRTSLQPEADAEGASSLHYLVVNFIYDADHVPVMSCFFSFRVSADSCSFLQAFRDNGSFMCVLMASQISAQSLKTTEVFKAFVDCSCQLMSLLTNTIRL